VTPTRLRTAHGSSPAIDRDDNGEHNVFALYKCGGGSNVGLRPDGGLGIGRYFRPDELEPIPEPP